MSNRRVFIKGLLATALTFNLPLARILGREKKLPQVLLIGDSISIGYTNPVKELLEGNAYVYRPLTPEGKPQNCLGTTFGLTKIDEWLSVSEWDLIHFNFGLHDLKHVDPLTGQNSIDPKHPQEAPVEKYRSKLLKIVERLIETGARLVFATITPFPDQPEGPYRSSHQVEIYNDAAISIMCSHNVYINDLYKLILPRMEELQIPNNVHFTAHGSQVLAEKVAEEITASLQENR